MRVRPFAALRPARGLESEVASAPYDVLDSLEARTAAGEKSLLHITKPEIDFPDPMPSEDDPRVYDRAVENFAAWQSRGWLVRDSKPCYYVYSQTMGSRTQHGFVLCAHCDDYRSGAIKKHELTRKDKEDDRMVHIRLQRANIEPVFFAFRRHDGLGAVLDEVTSAPAEYSFTDEHGFGHAFRPVTDDALISRITELFSSEVDAFYIADGHHRSAAAARVGAEMALADPSHTGDEEYNWFMAVCFPEDQLRVLDYNRVVKDLGGLSPSDFLARLSVDFDVQPVMDLEEFRPDAPHVFSMYLAGVWYRLEARPGIWDERDLLASLDVSILSDRVLDRILGIRDLRTSPRIDFVGGLRGLGELRRRVDSGEMAAAFALYPVSVSEIISIADAGLIMPPKTTWFEPKLRSGLAIHTF